jgi:DNA polymerase
MLVDAILKLETMGWPVVFHVHDEVVVAAPEADAERAKTEVERVLNTTPGWAVGLPVSSEVMIVDRYTK